MNARIALVSNKKPKPDESLKSKWKKESAKSTQMKVLDARLVQRKNRLLTD